MPKFSYDVPRESKSAYKKKIKPVYTIDSSIQNYMEKLKPLSADLYPLSSTIADFFIETIKAIDTRKELLSESKGRDEPVNIEWLKALCCLTLLSNKKVPNSELAELLFEDELDDADDRKSSKRKYIKTLNNYRDYLKRENLYGKETDSSDTLFYSYMMKYSRKHWNGKQMWLSLDEKAIQFYMDAHYHWTSVKATLNGKKHSWYNVYQIIASKKQANKPNSIRFISSFCKSNSEYSRSFAQQYLIIFNDKRCFTDDDLEAIVANGTMTKDGFFRMLNKIVFLTKKAL